MCKLRYLICLFATCVEQDVKFIWLYLLNLFINFFFNQSNNNRNRHTH